jgi:hypothetical protein
MHRSQHEYRNEDSKESGNGGIAWPSANNQNDNQAISWPSANQVQENKEAI